MDSNNVKKILKLSKRSLFFPNPLDFQFKGTLMQIRKSLYMFVFI